MSSTEIVDNTTTPLSALQTIGLGIPGSPWALQVVNYCVAFILTTIALTGIVGNGVVLYVISRYSRLRFAGGPLISNLATADLAVSFLHIPSAYSSYNERWAFGSLGCNLYAASLGLCRLVSLQTLTVIAADRFFVIIGRRKSWLAKRKTCAGLWALSLCLVLPPLVGWSQYRTEGMRTSCSWDYQSRDLRSRLYYLFLVTFGFILPVIIITVSYAGILLTVWNHRKEARIIERGLILTPRTPSQTAVKTSKVILTIIACFMVSGTPYAIVSAVGQFGTEEISPLVTELAGIFAKASVIANPVVYALTHPKFRCALRTLRSQSSWWGAINNGWHYVQHFRHVHRLEVVHKQEPEHNHGRHMGRYNQNYMPGGGTRKWGIAIQEDCCDGEPLTSPQTPTRVTTNKDGSRSKSWHLQTESSKKVGEVRTMAGQHNLLTPGGGYHDNVSCQTTMQLLDAAVASTRTGSCDNNIIVIDTPLSHSSSILTDNLTSSDNAVATFKIVSVELEGSITSSRSRIRDSRNPSEIETSKQQITSQARLEIYNKRAKDANHVSEDPRTVSMTTLAEQKGCPASHSAKNGDDSRSENYPASPPHFHCHHDHPHRNHQVCPTSPMRSKFIAFQFPGNPVQGEEEDPSYRHKNHHLAATSLATRSISRRSVEMLNERSRTVLLEMELVLLRKEVATKTEDSCRNRGFSRKRGKYNLGGGPRRVSV